MVDQRSAALSGIKAAKRRGEITAAREADLRFQVRDTGRTQESIQPGRGAVSPDLAQSVQGGPTLAEQTAANAPTPQTPGLLSKIGSSIKNRLSKGGLFERPIIGQTDFGSQETQPLTGPTVGDVGLAVSGLGGLKTGASAITALEGTSLPKNLGTAKAAKEIKKAYEATLRVSANDIALKRGGNANKIFKELQTQGTKQDINKAIREASKDPDTLLKFLGRHRGKLGLLTSAVIGSTLYAASSTKWAMLDNVIGQAGLRARDEIKDVQFNDKDPAVALANMQEDKEVADVALKVFRVATWIDATGWIFLKGWQAAGDSAVKDIDQKILELENMIANQTAAEEGTDAFGGEERTVENFEAEQARRGEVPEPS
jgi:hypothetical protein